ncbi:MAG TPA: hypothetical protein VE988_11295 [Gemmataceae bacterium]|nr:hypothetical protein [Gemmataceae bacterium]
MTAILHFAAFVSVSVAVGQDPNPAPKQEPKKDFNPAAVGSLVPAPLAADLKLDAEQKKNVDGLEQAFHKQRKSLLTITMMKINSLMDKIEREEEPNPLLAVSTLMIGTLSDITSTKSAYQKKVSDVLTADQQRKFAAWQKLKPKDKKEPEPEDLLQLLLQEHGLAPLPGLDATLLEFRGSVLPPHRLE